ncbi:MAG TPA: F0F1 ATP synthase subunit B [Spirochaetota bacterium]|nr:F0F1 ATP synthase subunit B [Spirochaetota bacterium]HNT11354.1 F0F1 ATP synthase subunit B [Spirochaetota bacterium]HNV47176.1 F0F1 ATP synthase subunit B [Spirochaetota bacterium]HOS38739.1 F0F1 ATP synthase subunit B [Spirochaetota bacterium]HPU90501.1 F0F1 ATP synthase subunit B [Spirochaetota bacterium]
MDAIREGLLKVDPGLYLWTLVTFIVLVLILWKAAWKPLVEALDLRAEKVRNDIETAEKNRIEAEKIFEDHKAMMNNAKNEAAKLIADGKADAERLRSGLLEKANEEAQKIMEHAKREITLSKDKALGELKNEIALLSTEIASKIIVKNLKPEDQKAIVEEALTKIRTVQ